MKSFLGIIVVFVIEISLLVLTALIDRVNQSKQKKGIKWVERVMLFILEIGTMWLVGGIAGVYSWIEALHDSKVASIVFPILTFGIVNVFFEFPTWKEDASEYHITLKGKRLKLALQSVIIVTSASILWWQQVGLEEMSKDYWVRVDALTELLARFAVICVVMVVGFMAPSVIIYNHVPKWFNAIFTNETISVKK